MITFAKRSILGATCGCLTLAVAAVLTIVPASADALSQVSKAFPSPPALSHNRRLAADGAQVAPEAATPTAPSASNQLRTPASPIVAQAEPTLLPIPPPQPIRAAGSPVQPALPVIEPGRSDEDRAKEVLAQENKQTVVLNPLQTASPDYNIVVCEAGCGAKGQHVVYKALKSQPRSATASATPVILPADAATWTSASGAKIQPLNAIPSRPPAAVATSQPTAPSAEAAKPTSPASREDWLARINRERAADKPATETPVAPKS